MKAILACILILCLIIGTLCFKGHLQQSKERAFYYCNMAMDYSGDNPSVLAENRADAPDGSLQEILELYLSGPLSQNLRSPFPAHLKLIGVSQTGETIYLTFSRELATLTGLDLTMACCCITLTTLALTDAQQVEIRTVTDLLDGQRSITMRKDTLLLLDNTNEE